MMRLGTFLCLAMLVVAGTAHAAVGSLPLTVSVKPGLPFSLSIDLTTTGVAGINGEVNYDSALLQNPSMGGTSLSGFTALGNELQPGKYRFVLYANPTSVIPLQFPAIHFNFVAGPGFTSGVSTQVSYVLEAASDSNGNSLPNVNFANSTVKTLTLRNSTTDWPIYE